MLVPWLSGIRKFALVSGHGPCTGSSHHEGRKFLVYFGHYMGPVPIQHRVKIGELGFCVLKLA